MRKANRHACTI